MTSNINGVKEGKFLQEVQTPIIHQEVSYFHKKYKNNIFEVLEFESQHPFFDELKNFFDSQLVSQENAKNALSQAILDSVLRIKPPKGPLGVFFFHGPTGVGKTEIVKALSECIFGAPNGVIKINCENFQESHTGANLFGSPKGYVGYGENTPFTNKNIMLAHDIAKQNGKLNEFIKDKLPWINIILFDEIEKAHPNVLQQLLGLLDEGSITTSKGEVVNFQNSLIIFTSNLGQREISQEKNKTNFGFISSEEDKEIEKSEIFKKSLQSRFSPEFIGRIHEFIEFESLSQDDCKQIIDIEVNKLNLYLEKYFQESYIQLELSPKIYDTLLKDGYSQDKGARELIRTYQAMVEKPLNRLLSSKEFEKFFNRDIIIGIDINKNNQPVFHIIPTKSQSPEPVGLLTNETSPNISLSLKDLQSVYHTINAYIALGEISLDNDIDIREELLIYSNKLQAFGLSNREIASLKTRAYLEGLKKLDFIHDFESFGLGDELNIFFPIEIRTVQTMLQKKFYQFKQDKNIFIHDIERHLLGFGIETIAKVLGKDELSIPQINHLVHLVRKVIVEN